jgi:hypothetical protein
LFFTYEWILVGTHNVPFSSIWYFIPLFIMMWGTFALLALKRFMNFKSKTIPILTYVFSVTLQGTLGLFLAIYFSNLKMLVVGTKTLKRRLKKQQYNMQTMKI